jgi:uncharacterized phage protein gp47/JayE
VTYPVPTLAQIIARVINDLGPAASLRRSFERALSRAISAVSHSLHGHIGWASRQATPATATSEEIVTAWATMFGLTRKQPTQAPGFASGTGTNGTTIPAGTIGALDDGTRFTVDADATVSGGVVTVAITSVDYASTTNCDAGATWTLVSPISGIDSAFTIDDDITGGSDLETIDDLKQRLLDRMEAPPRGGSEADYEAWAKATPGVDIATVAVLVDYDGDGTIAIVFTMDAVDPIPSGGDVTAVQDYVDPLRPAVLRDFTAYAPTSADVTYDIQIAPYPSSATEAAILASLAGLHRREATPGGTLLLSHINEAISAATGETDHVLVAPSADVVAATVLEIPTFNASLVTFSAIP